MYIFCYFKVTWALGERLPNQIIIGLFYNSNHSNNTEVNIYYSTAYYYLSVAMFVISSDWLINISCGLDMVLNLVVKFQMVRFIQLNFCIQKNLLQQGLGLVYR